MTINYLQLLLLDLFEEMRSPLTGEMKLTIEQFDLLCQAVAASGEIRDWEQLRRLCRLVWVKPHEDCDAERFDRAFDAYIRKCQIAVEEVFAGLQIEPVPEIAPTPPVNLGVLPEIPPRIFPQKKTEPRSPATSTLQSNANAATAIKTWNREGSQFVLRQLPVTLEAIEQIWRSLHRPWRSSQELELDLDATIAEIARSGFLSDLVQRPVLRQQAELLLLVDDDNPMIPFRPAIDPLIQAANENRLGRAQVYRFTTYPVEYLYNWHQPTQGITLSTVLARLHRQRTIAAIVSDGGAASGSYNWRRVEETAKFLARLLPCVRDLLWINPVPSPRWERTSAAAIQVALAGRMLPLDRLAIQRVARGQEVEAEVQLWSSMA